MAVTNQTSTAVLQGTSPIGMPVDEANRNLDINGLPGSTGTSTLQATLNRLLGPLQQTSQVSFTEYPGVSSGPGSSVVVDNLHKRHTLANR